MYAHSGKAVCVCEVYFQSWWSDAQEGRCVWEREKATERLLSEKTIPLNCLQQTMLCMLPISTFRSISEVLLFWFFLSTQHTSTRSVQGKVCATLKKKTCENFVHTLYGSNVRIISFHIYLFIPNDLFISPRTPSLPLFLWIRSIDKFCFHCKCKQFQIFSFRLIDSVKMCGSFVETKFCCFHCFAVRL